MANEEHLAKLMEGVEAWNAWVKEKRSEDKNFKADLSGAELASGKFAKIDFFEADLTKADFRGADLSNASLIDANLTDAKLSDANLTGVWLGGAIFKGAELRLADLTNSMGEGADLTNADLWGAKFRRAILVNVNFSAAKLNNTFFNEANLANAILAGANLGWADLSGAKLSALDLTDVPLFSANLSDADLTYVEGLEVDNCRVLRTQFSANARDKWSILRRTYTGPRLVLNLLFLLLFFVPLAIKSAGLLAIGDAELHAIEALNRFDNYQLKIQCGQPTGAITGVVRGEEVRVPCRTQPLWKMLLGYGGPFGAFMPYLTGVLIGYQLLRYWMTMRISAMREAEERSGISPPRGGPFNYRQLFWVHRLLSVVFLATVVAFGLRASEFLTSDLIFIGSGHP